MLHLLYFDKGAFEETSRITYGEKKRKFPNCINVYRL